MVEIQIVVECVFVSIEFTWETEVVLSCGPVCIACYIFATVLAICRVRHSLCCVEFSMELPSKFSIALVVHSVDPIRSVEGLSIALPIRSVDR